MVKTTRQQREALFRIFLRDFPSWLTPTLRLRDHKKYQRSLQPYTARELAGFGDRHPEEVIKVPSIQYRNFRKTVRGGPGCIMLPWKGIFLGIEPDGHTHS